MVTVIYVIMLKTGYEIALVAILVGFIVGKAVRAGSGGGGGRAYQVLAVALTYCSIVSSYVPRILDEVSKLPTASKEEKGGGSPGGPEKPATAPPAVEEKPGQKPGFLSLVLALAVIFALAIAYPWLLGFQKMMSWIIIMVAIVDC